MKQNSTVPPVLASWLASFALEASVVFLPLFATDVGASRLHVGLIGGVYGAAYFVSSLLFGRLSDIRGRLLFIRLGLGTGALAFLFQAFASDVVVLMLARTVVGFSLGIAAAALLAYNFEAGGSTGKYAGFGSLGMFAGDILAVFVHNYHVLLVASIIACAAAFFVSLRFMEGPRYQPIRPVTGRVVRRNTRIYVAFLLRHTGANMVWAVLPLFLATLGADKTWIGVLYAINDGGQFVAMMFVERLGGGRAFALGLLLSIFVFLGYSHATGYLQIIPIQIVLAVAWSCLYVGALILLLKSNQERATATGILFSTSSLSTAAGPFLGGVAAQYGGYQSLMYVAAAFSIAGLGVASVGRRKSEPDRTT